MGVFARKRRSGIVYYVSFVWNGKQVQERAGTDKRQAQLLERRRKREVRDGTYRADQQSGSTTLGSYAVKWLDARSLRGIRTVSDDATRLRLHVLPTLGSRRLDSITRQDVRSLVEGLRVSRKVAPKTVRNIYGTLRTLLRDALIDELILADPCILPRNTLPSPRDVSPSTARRQPSIFTLEEVQLLLTDERVPPDRRVLFALLFLTGMRHGEAVGRRFRDFDRSPKPLGALTVGTQYNDQPLKTKTPRVVPVHPVLADMLVEWQEAGFRNSFGRSPTPDELIVPSRTGKCRVSGTTHQNLQRDCKAVGIPGRRTHDTRHTFISMARRGGARKEIVERITHNSAGDIVDRYTTFDWEPLCEAVLCVRLVFDSVQGRLAISVLA